MKEQELLDLNAEGLIPGPEETEEDFKRRVEETKLFFQAQTNSFPPHYWQWPQEQLKSLFDFAPRWCAAAYSSEGLTPWQAAATWIDVKRIYLIRLHPARWVQRWVDRSEILAHEAAHAARAAFNEPKHEELFAFLTSSSKWRRTLGPLFIEPKEASWLIAFLGIGGLSQIMELLLDINLFSSIWLLMALFSCCIWSLRLTKTRIRIERAAKRLIPFLKDPAMVRPVLFRMTDAEIEQLAGSLPFQPGTDLRWKLIKIAYWKDCYDTTH